MSWKSRLDSVSAVARTAQQTGSEVAAAAIEPHWPTIQRILREQVAPTTAAAISNDQLLEQSVRRLHRLLPMPVRLVIRQQMLVDWCFNNRERVLLALRPDGQESEASL